MTKKDLIEEILEIASKNEKIVDQDEAGKFKQFYDAFFLIETYCKVSCITVSSIIVPCIAQESSKVRKDMQARSPTSKFPSKKKGSDLTKLRASKFAKDKKGNKHITAKPPKGKDSDDLDKSLVDLHCGSVNLQHKQLVFEKEQAEKKAEALSSAKKVREMSECKELKDLGHSNNEILSYVSELKTLIETSKKWIGACEAKHIQKINKLLF